MILTIFEVLLITEEISGGGKKKKSYMWIKLLLHEDLFDDSDMCWGFVIIADF